MEQLSVFIENRVGTLAEAVGILAREGVDIRAFCLSDTADFGVMHMIVSDTARAAAALREGGYVVSADDVLAVEADDRPGAFFRVLTTLAQAGVGVEYSYAFTSAKDADRAHFIMKTTDRAAAERALAENRA